MESAWSNGEAAYRCRHGHTNATRPDPCRAKNAYIREDRILPRLPSLHLLLTGAELATERRRRTRRGVNVRGQVSEEKVIGYLRDRGITLTYDPAAGTLQAGTAKATKTAIGKAS
jgi:site-specific DNA recombinase